MQFKVPAQTSAIITNGALLTAFQLQIVNQTYGTLDWEDFGAQIGLCIATDFSAEGAPRQRIMSFW